MTFMKRFLTMCTALLLTLCTFSQSNDLREAIKRSREHVYTNPGYPLVVNDPYIPPSAFYPIHRVTDPYDPVKGVLRMYVADPTVIKIGDTTYFPGMTDSYQRIRQAAFAVITPRNYDPAKQYDTWMIIHGMGERSEGRLENLRNLTQGFDYSANKTGPRQYALVTPKFAEQINKNDFIAVIVTYQGEFNPTDVNFVFDEVEKNFSVNKSREALIGFSLGGGAVTRYITSSVANANRIAFAVACASVNWASDYNIVRTAELPTLFVTAQSDPTVSPNNTKTMVAGINQGAKYPAYAVYLPYTGHTGFQEVLEGDNQYLPQNPYAYLKQLTKDAPKAYPISSGGGTIPPPVVVPGAPVIIRETVPAITITGSVPLLACKSTGYDWFTWTVISVPQTASLWTPYINGAGNCQAGAKFTIEGAYGIKATACKGNTCVSDTLYVTYQKSSQPVPKTASKFDSKTGILIFSDGSQEPATGVIDFKAGTATATSSSGTYNLK